MDKIIIIYNGYDKNCLEFIADSDNESYQKIDWYKDEILVSEYLSDTKNPPISQFPSVIDTELKSIISKPLSVSDAIIKMTSDVDKSLRESLLRKRDRLLKESDLYMFSDFPKNGATEQAILDYRESLRNITDQEDYPTSVTFPINPVKGVAE